MPIFYKDNVIFLKTVCLQAALKKRLLQINHDDPNCNYFEVFSSENRLCSIFPLVNLDLEELPKLETKLAFCLPKPSPPSLPLNLDLKLFEKIDVKLLLIKEYS